MDDPVKPTRSARPSGSQYLKAGARRQARRTARPGAQQRIFSNVMSRVKPESAEPKG